jgi:hypothetical protein
VRSPLALALLAALVPTVPAGAQTGAFARFLGGGRASTDCMLVTEIAGASGGQRARCIDGDPACDADARTDGVCTVHVRLCLDAVDPNTPRCHADVVTGADASLPELTVALQALALPVITPSCTPPMAVTVPRRGRRGRVILRASANMASGHADRDHVTIVCRRPAHPSATFATVQRRVFTPSCATLSCHGAAVAGGLDLSLGTAFASLVGVPSSNAAAHAAGLLRVAPGDPERSFLLRKLEGTLGAGEGDPMPRVGTRLPAASIDLVRRWIAAGASADAGF